MSQIKLGKRIALYQMAPHIHNFCAGENKVDKLYRWLHSWINQKLKSGEIAAGDLMPAKGELAFHIGVSKGTIQNVYRLLENSGIVESKQRIGTYIKDNTNYINADKLTSKREVICQQIKNYILNNNLKEGDKLPPIRSLCLILKTSQTTLRIAINSLVLEDILIKKNNTFCIKNFIFSSDKFEYKTLVEKISDKIKKYINENLHAGDKLPPNKELAEKYNVSVKTIHDSIKLLVKSGLLLTKRGKYGTLVANENSSSELYYYEHAELKIKNFIQQNCKVGDKLPTIREMAKSINVSTKTIKVALDNLMEEGFIMFQRGRNGGTFVTDIPQSGNESYTWIALNPKYISAIEN